RAYIKVTGSKAVSEPFVDVIIDFAWSSGRLQRAYTLLIDPPPTRAPAPPPVAAAAPSIAPAPVQTAPVAPPPPMTAPPVTPPSRPVAPPPPAPPPPAPKPVAIAPRPAAPPAAPAGPDSYRVHSGDTLSSIASSHSRSGVSLDQMLVALFRGNPQAFIDSNMNRLKSGVVLDVPDAGTAKDVQPEEAKKVIQAHSADFAAFRQRLAGAAPTIKATEPARQATGQVQAAVKDRKTDTGAASPDKLTLSQGTAKPGSTEAKLSKEAEKKAAETRVAELSRNVQELKQLQDASKAAPAAATKPGATAPAPAATGKPGLIGVPATTTTPPAPAPAATKPAVVAPPPPAPVPAPAPVVAAKPAPAPAPVVPLPAPVASAPAAKPAASVAAPPAPVAAASAPTAPVAASMPPVAASRPAPKRAPVPPPAEPSFFDSLTGNPLVLPAAAFVVALLGGLAWVRLRRRRQDGAAETSFIESKLQPDSFFGVSGGQRVDTRDGASGSSSLSYSLSQLDAIGDVDPVAEADVYLAYGRDLQAEEILKEALRSDPGRVAIRSKLLEVYAKRADTKAFDAQARQLLEQTGGEGEDWDKAVELGRAMDPTNPLYGGEGRVMAVDIDTSSEPPPDLREDYRPAEPPVTPVEKTQPLVGEVLLDTAPGNLDVDLGAPSKISGIEPTRPMETASGMLDAGHTIPGLPPIPPTPVAPAPAVVDELPTLDFRTEQPPEKDAGPVTTPSTFDFGDLSLDLGAPQGEESTVRGGLPAEEIDDTDPLARKLELADEFRRIGDMEGARDLLEEVVSKAEGALQARAQAMLNDLE
ncbi:MAG TPA: FimV/HubP family polar landmark protein, partial [Ideonella sp.]|nr:FimV/HubP family polar landmark protein [Ideonella sp.]